ncbi:MAG: sigma-70 family RNA polymerase sigma factor [Phycisphaera sp.]|nr:sigma-70 family RNA polymerase sigma factor [Phycisphaera sp.]
MRRQLEGIYRQHRQGLYTLALSITRRPEQAEDAVHEAFVRLCRTQRKAEGDPTAYVYAAVRNAAIDQIRKQARRSQPVSIYADTVVDTGSTPLGAAEDTERARLIREALEQLSPAQRETIVMKLYGGLTFEQIAQASGEPLSTVSSRYRRGLDRLRESVEALV